MRTLSEEADVGRVALVVNDGDAVASFYRSVVGLSVLSQAEKTTVLGAGDEPLLVLTEDETAPERHPEGTGLFHAAFKVPTRAALGDALQRIRGRWELSGAADHLVSEALYCSDPEGNGVEVYRDRPRNDWPIRTDGRVEMSNQRLPLDDLASDATGDDTVPAGSSVGHVHLEVSSLPETREFYVDVLDLNVRQETWQSSLFLATDDYHHHLAVNTWNHRSRPMEGRGLDWFEFVVPGGDDLAAIRARVADTGATVTAIDHGVEVTDPDGIPVRFVTPDAVA